MKEGSVVLDLWYNKKIGIGTFDTKFIYKGLGGS